MLCLVAEVLSVSEWAEPRGVTDTCSWTQSVSSPNPTKANCSQMSSDIRQLTPRESNRENDTFHHLTSAFAECAQAYGRVADMMSMLHQYITAQIHLNVRCGFKGLGVQSYL